MYKYFQNLTFVTRKNSIYYPVGKFFSAILKAAREVDTRTLSGNKFHSLLA